MQHTAVHHTTWHRDAIFYHIYPLGFCGDRGLAAIREAIPHLKKLGVTALYLGPVFASSNHGYDTSDYFRIDPRLGTEQDFRDLVHDLHRSDIRVVLDGVFNHVGREFWAFSRLQEEGSSSAYRHWFSDVDFSTPNPYGDPFSYQGWEGHFDLVTLNLEHEPVQEHLLQAVEWMISNLGIDGLRLDVAYCLPKWFLRRLRSHTDNLHPDFYLLGEVIHGDYGSFLGDDLLHAVTNYECFKGLWSSHNDANYFEIAHSITRQFGDGAQDKGVSGGHALYNFADNHDVDRVASVLDNPAHVFPLYGILMTLPGSPSLYYGSEFALTGRKQDGDDRPLRPDWARVTDSVCTQSGDHSHGADLQTWLQKLADVRTRHPALRSSCISLLHVAHQQIAYLRSTEDQQIVVAMNAGAEPSLLQLKNLPGNRLQNLLGHNSEIPLSNGSAAIELPAYGTALYEVIQ
ncbi:alpha-amylase family glycosyl hydrolase [Spirochaeta africana]|uniref:Glycosidase n=1 Tax=Spirochaeta africana (strain ATCC 700263 / DSM 8902 / Z-7692) TaxID=889378 RepID=H9UFC6_SPIAZ|nr:alpha-amylase family glycosyl hydrolase [Spirochaeta africana]AFG36219.1 glycosidase [Spirochaeta africana DSM 8902]